MALNGTTQAVEFKQSAIIEKLASMAQKLDGEESTLKQLKRIKGGFCYALSLEWLRLAAEEDVSGGTGNPGMSLALNGANLVQIDDKQAYSYFKQIANNFITYAESSQVAARIAKPDDFLSAPHNFLDRWEIDEFFLTVGSKNALSPTGGMADKDAAALTALLQSGAQNYYFVGFSLVNSKFERMAGHRIAFCRRAGKLYGFDPNLGIFLISNLPSFMAALEGAYRSPSYHLGHFYGTYV